MLYEIVRHESFGFNPYIVNLIISFLDGRRQRVVVDSISTEWAIINKGNITKCLMAKFADDITLSIAVKVNAPDPCEIEVENVKKWARDNRTVLHMNKTWEMVERGRTRKSLPEQVEGVTGA